MSDQTSNPAKPGAPKTPTSENLWPKINPDVKVRTPAAILKEQAALLGQMTQNIVRAEVRAMKSEIADELVFAFVIVAPALDNYTLWLFAAHHKPTEIYPVTLNSSVVVPPGKAEGIWKANNEHVLKNQLKIIFSNERTQKAIQSLLAQSQGIPIDR